MMENVIRRQRFTTRSRDFLHDEAAVEEGFVLLEKLVGQVSEREETGGHRIGPGARDEAQSQGMIGGEGGSVADKAEAVIRAGVEAAKESASGQGH